MEDPCRHKGLVFGYSMIIFFVDSS